MPRLTLPFSSWAGFPTHRRLSPTGALAMASRILARSKALPLAAALTRAAADAAPPLAGTRALSSLSRYTGAPSPHGLGKVRSSPRPLVSYI
jgi:hypothetical protein